MPTLGSEIRRWKTKTGKSADDLAKIVGCSRRTVFDWQAGRSIPSAEHRPALAEALGMSSDDLLGAIDEAKTTPIDKPRASVPLAGDPLPKLDELAERLELWRGRVVESGLDRDVTAILHTLPFYMRISGEIRVDAEQLADDTGWNVDEVRHLLELAEDSGLVEVVRAGVYRLR